MRCTLALSFERLVWLGGALLGHLQNGAPKGTESEDVRCQRRVAGKW